MGFGKKDMTGSSDTFDDFGGVITKARFGVYTFGQSGSSEKGLILTFKMDSGFEHNEVYGPGKKAAETFTPSEDGFSFTGTVANKSKIEKLVTALEKLGIEIKGDDPRELEGISAHWEKQSISLGKDTKGEPMSMKVLLPTKLREAFKSKEAVSAELDAAVDSTIVEVLKAGPVSRGALVGKLFPKLPEAIRQKGAERALEEAYLTSSGRPFKYADQTLSL